MLNFNEAQSALKRREQESNTAPYKILILDEFSQSIIAPLVGVKELRQKGGVTLHLQITNTREAIPDVPAVYFVRPTAENIELILKVPVQDVLLSSCHNEVCCQNLSVGSLHGFS